MSMSLRLFRSILPPCEKSVKCATVHLLPVTPITTVMGVFSHGNWQTLEIIVWFLFCWSSGLKMMEKIFLSYIVPIVGILWIKWKVEEIIILIPSNSQRRFMNKGSSGTRLHCFTLILLHTLTRKHQLPSFICRNHRLAIKTQSSAKTNRNPSESRTYTDFTIKKIVCFAIYL